MFTPIELLIILLLALIIAGLLLNIGRSLVFSLTMLHGPVYVPSSDDRLAAMLKLAKPKKSDKIVDLGSGDGKVVIALAQRGYKIDGYEINPILVWQSRRQITKLGLQNHAKIYQKNFWKVDFSPYSLVLLYGTSYIMKKLENKLQTELQPGARVISNYFQLPSKKSSDHYREVFKYQF